MIVGRKTEDIAHICILLLHDGYICTRPQTKRVVRDWDMHLAVSECIKVHAVRYGFDDPVRAS
jgi:hypothetical protein